MTSLHYNTLLSLLLLLLFLHLHHPPTTASFQPAATDDDDLVEEYTLDDVDSPLSPLKSTRGRVLKKIRKGARCTTDYFNRYNICNGVSANNGTSILHCCKKHCRNVLGDKNNCGFCRHKCRFGHRCCGGLCIDVMRDPLHCGKCNTRCPFGVMCDYGICGYA